MPSYIVYILVNGGQIICNEDTLYADSVGHIVLEFSFDESWEGLLKTAVFRVDEKVYALPLEKNRCTIPAEALRGGILNVSVFGVLGTTRATTGEFPIRVESSGYIKITPQSEATDPYNYFLERATNLKEAAEAAAATANEASTAALQAKTDIEGRISDLSFRAISSGEYAAALSTGTLLDDCIYFVYEEE